MTHILSAAASRSQVAALATAALGLLAAPAAAVEVIDHRAYPGSHCSSDGPSELNQMGVRENTAPPGTGNGYQTFSCAIPVPWYVNDPSYSKRVLFVAVHLMRNNLGAAGPTSCRVSTSYHDQNTLYADDVAQASATGADREYVLLRAELPPNASSWVASAVFAKAHLRCRLYNSAAPRNALIGFSVRMSHTNQ